MKNLIIIALLLFGLNVIAQKVPFETLESYSKYINAFQQNANGKIYNDGQNYYEVTFPEVSFNVSFHNQLATKAVYKKNEEKETFELTENIDLSEAIEVKNYSYGGVAGALRIYFPIGSIKTKVFENGELKHTYSETYVELFYDKTSDNDKMLCIAWVNELIAVFKREQNKSYEKFFLQAYYYNLYASNSNFKMGSKDKTRQLAEILMALNNKDIYYSLGFNAYVDKDYDSARTYFERAMELGNYDGNIWLGYLDKRQDLRDTAIYKQGFYALTSEGYNYANKLDYARAVYYYEKAVQVSHPAFHARRSAMTDLHRYYLKNRDFDKAHQFLLDETIFSSGLYESDILEMSNNLLVAIGKCNEALALLNKTVNSPNIDTVMYQAYEKLEILYYNGCKGDNGNKVSKSSKLAKEAAAKKRTFPYGY